MSVMVRKLYKSGTFLYKMQLLAGRSGLNHLVKWVHIIEDEDVTSFLHGNELVFSAGILNQREDWLLDFTRRLHEVGASAFVVNIGPHTKQVPKEVVEYCNQMDMPLFTIPWETRMVDMTRDFCHQIMRNEQMEDDMVTTLKNMIFKVGDLDSQVLQLERYGCMRDSRLCFICVNAGSESIRPEDENGDLKMIAEKTAKELHELFISFVYNGNRILALIDYSDAEVKLFLSRFVRNVKRDLPALNLHLGISSNQEGLYDQNANFDKALSAMEMACKRGETVIHYDELGIYKMLYALSDKTILRDYYYDVIGKLEKYDRENHTQLMQTLRTYLENNGSLQLVSEKQYVHRNTVTNQLKKIEKITGYNPLDLDDKVKFCMGLYIQDIL